MFEFRILPDGGEPFEITASMRDLRMWEKTHRGRSMGVLSDRSSLSATILFEIAYAACRRQGKIHNDMTGDVFAETHDFELGEEVEEEEPAEKLGNPTPAALSAAPLSP
ncbi:hypothetical protein [Brevundimonas sp.]|uniref:hypothetical protein n=1 Tax=Brevundimonas sp. TaxID=1871086 RepID=UPI002D47F8F1|nr:hypothetical protein [Brevundimonas sp.]HYD28882.1 hypothetical protein [Brevundimonas sp.]